MSDCPNSPQSPRTLDTGGGENHTRNCTPRIDPNDEWLTQRKAAELLKVCARTLYTYREKGVIPATGWKRMRGPGSAVRYRRSAIMSLEGGGE